MMDAHLFYHNNHNHLFQNPRSDPRSYKSTKLFPDSLFVLYLAFKYKCPVRPVSEQYCHYPRKSRSNRYQKRLFIVRAKHPCGQSVSGHIHEKRQYPKKQIVYRLLILFIYAPYKLYHSLFFLSHLYTNSAYNPPRTVLSSSANLCDAAFFHPVYDIAFFDRLQSVGNDN